MLLYLTTGKYVSPNNNEIISCTTEEVGGLIYIDEQRGIMQVPSSASSQKPHFYQKQVTTIATHRQLCTAIYPLKK